MTLLLCLLGAVTVSSKIDTVVVYRDQVVVRRSATVNLTGNQQLIFSGLPGALVDNSVRVRAEGLKLGEVQIKRGYLAEPTPEVKRLEQRVRMLEDSSRMLEDEAVVLKAKEEFLNSIKLGAPEVIAKELQQGKVAPESWRGALSFIGEELSRVKARQLGLKRAQEELKKRLDAARQELEEMRALVENRKELMVAVEGEPGLHQISFSYAIPGGADWQPYYELRAEPGRRMVNLAYFARVSQRTGEDWEDVKLILSTGEPTPAIAPPEPFPWYLDIIEETFRVKRLPTPGAMAETQVVLEGLSEDAVTPVETGISLLYVIPGKISLKSGEGAKKLPLVQVSLPTEFEFYTLPRSRENAFLTGRMVNTSQFLFIGGEANTYVGEEFTGTTALASIAPQDSLVIGFGIDERVKVKRELVKTFKSTSGLLGKTERINFVYRTTVENYHPQKVKIKIIEQVPVSRQKEIKVTVTMIEPRYQEYNENDGTYTYLVDLRNGEKLEVNLEFNVEYPKGKKISGLY